MSTNPQKPMSEEIKELIHDLYSAYSWIVDAGHPMDKHNASVLLRAAKALENNATTPPPTAPFDEIVEALKDELNVYADECDMDNTGCCEIHGHFDFDWKCPIGRKRQLVRDYEATRLTLSAGSGSQEQKD